MDVRFLGGSVFQKLNLNRILVFCTSLIIPRDQPNSREKNVRFHGRVFKMCQISLKELRNSRAHSYYLEVIC